MLISYRSKRLKVGCRAHLLILFSRGVHDCENDTVVRGRRPELCALICKHWQLEEIGALIPLIPDCVRYLR